MLVRPDKLRAVGINLHRYVDCVGTYTYHLDVNHHRVDVVSTGFFKRVHTSIDVTKEQIASLIA